MSRKPITPKGANLLSKVTELIDPITGGWDTQLVPDTFWEEDAQLILAIPVHGGMENRAAWRFDKKGVLSVKSAYKVFRTNQVNGSRGGLIFQFGPRPDPVMEQNLEHPVCK